MSVTIYHNPKCAKSRATLKLLTDRGIKPTVIEYLKTPPSEAELKKLIGMLGITPRALLRTKEAEYKQAKLDDAGVSDAQIVKAMVKHPKLIERPIVVVAGDVQGRTSVAKGRKPGATKKAALGRPPEAVLKIL